ncbi:MAG: phenylalanine--tRNA ligase subunit beta, partial [Porphyromonadaceae bacterium]|nr:phenylalanine--tRNA ligase subunit beta [Porphyromonadaceae bacterium]
VLSTRGGKKVGALGIVSEKILKRFDLSAEIAFADLHWSALMRLLKGQVTFADISKFPSVKRDLALLIDETVTFAEVEKAVLEADRKFIRKVTLFDVYEGKNLPAGKKSYAISLLLQDEAKTLQDKLIEHIMSRVVANLQNKVGATLR